MASVKKFTAKAVKNLLRHNNREIVNDRNKYIDKRKTSQNYSLTPDRGSLTEFEYFKVRKAQVHCHNRSDVITVAGWICPLPPEVTEAEQQKEFFQLTYSFLQDRYGMENVIQATVHYDECISVMRRSGNGDLLYDVNGQPECDYLLGRPHLHFVFIPVTRDENPRHSQREKICAKEVLGPQELRRFHADYQRYLDAHGMKARVVNRLPADNCPWCADEDETAEKSDINRLRDEIRKARRWTNN